MSPSPPDSTTENKDEEKEVAQDTEDTKMGEDEDEEAYRLRVYGTAKCQEEPRRPNLSRTREGSFRRLSKRVSHQITRQGSAVVESLPETPAGWTVLVSALLSAALGYEIQLQKSLTQPPITFGQFQSEGPMAAIYNKLTATPESILSRKIQPSLFLGTRGVVASTAAYLLGGPSSTEEHIRFREVVHMTQDGAAIGVDWELPTRTTLASNLSVEERMAHILKGPIREPVVIILHGINNDASFGYVRSLMRTFANRGWNAAGMNFRGVGGVAMTTPRGYNAGYTGDLRCLVHTISGRLDENIPIFIVGNSLGANILTKYLGEEGLSGTLPKCVAGAASLGNPLQIHSGNVPFPFSVLMAMGVKKIYLDNWNVLRKVTDANHRNTILRGFMQSTIGKFDNTVAPILIRNDSFYPFTPRIGYEDGEAYWSDTSSYRNVPHISVPFLNLTAGDDFLVSRPSRNKIGFCLANPNVMVVETRCGGHLGWQESPPESEGINFGASSWADVACADFFQAVMHTNMQKCGAPVCHVENHSLDSQGHDEIDMDSITKTVKDEALQSTSEIRSRL